MKAKRFLALALMTCLLILTYTVSTQAYYWTTGVRLNNIPGGGSSVTNYSEPNVKQDSATYASFYATQISAGLGNSAKIVNSEGASRSQTADLYVNTLKRASSNDTVANYYYYVKVYSHWIEWGNGNYVVLDFSADWAQK